MIILLKVSVTTIIFVAEFYSLYSIHPKILKIKLLFFIAPTAAIDSGQRSRTSIIQGLILKKDNNLPLTAVKNWGDVATIISVLINRPTINEETPKEI